MELSKKITDILEDNDFGLCGEVEKQDDKYYVELEFSSPCGEDVIETIWFDGTNEGFVKAVSDDANSFDVDEHVELWVNGRGKNGVPDSIKELVEDADAIQESLNNIAEMLNTIK